MVKLGGFIIDEMLGQLILFKFIKSIGNSVKLHTEKLNKKRSSYKHKRDEKVQCR